MGYTCLEMILNKDNDKWKVQDSEKDRLWYLLLEM